jgi:two-component system NtrC family sensor kinase
VYQVTDGTVAPKLAPTKVAILGAGRGGTALLDLLHLIPSIEIVGISDRDPGAPGLARAKNLRIPVIGRIEDLVYNDGIPETEMLSGSAARVLWELVRHEANLQAELFHAEKLAGIGSFAAGIAHDINNPLQLIMGLAENLAEEKDLDAVHEQAREIVEAVRRTSAISRDLTQYARKTSARDETIVPLNNRFDEALKIARYAVSFHDISVRKQYDDGAVARGNPDEVLHMLVNMITNAVQAMKQDGGILTLTTEHCSDGAMLRICDTGCGMPAAVLDKIFDPFFTTKETGKGTGLGLYNVKTIVAKMRGNIRVESHVDRGTTFTIAFPPATEDQP